MDYLNLVDENFSYANSNDKKEISFKGLMGDMPFSAYLYIKKDSDKLFVILNGAVADKFKGGTVYQRWSWHNEFPGSVLYISDPSLIKHTELSLAWYIGDKDNKIDKDIANLVDRVADHLKVSKVIAYGSSGGGFAAIQLACNIKNSSIAVAINPQIKILHHRKNTVDLYLDSCWKGFSKKDLESDLSFDALENFRNNSSQILYVQNKVDELHYKTHFLPFLEALSIKDESLKRPLSEQKGLVRTLIYDHESGHAAEPKELLPDIFKAIENF